MPLRLYCCTIVYSSFQQQFRPSNITLCALVLLAFRQAQFSQTERLTLYGLVSTGCGRSSEVSLKCNNVLRKAENLILNTYSPSILCCNILTFVKYLVCTGVCTGEAVHLFPGRSFWDVADFLLLAQCLISQARGQFTFYVPLYSLQYAAYWSLFIAVSVPELCKTCKHGNRPAHGVGFVPNTYFISRILIFHPFLCRHSLWSFIHGKQRGNGDMIR
jgi:hypothetical protein